MRGRVSIALDLVRMGHSLRTHPRIGREVRLVLTAHREALLYELAYLHVFSAWEVFLEEVFLRYLCGYEFCGTQEPIRAGCAFAANLTAARTALFGSKPYLLWHNPSTVVGRANQHFDTGNRVATVLGSALSDIEDFAAIRHRIAHDHSDARLKFDAATMRLSAIRVRSCSAGDFLKRSTLDYAGNPTSWLERISSDLTRIALQLAP
jgi:hypothetical protein